MDNKLPTAQEFYTNYKTDLPYGGVPVSELMTEFTKLHVKAALEAAADNAILGTVEDNDEYLKCKLSILNAYPESLIK